MTLSYKEFMEDVRMRLRNYSLEDMRTLILNWAGEEHPAKRREFLSKLLTAPKQTDEVVSHVHVETLLDEIAAFGHRVKEGDYCDGWGWDDAIHDERDWGDESWAEEMDEFLLEVRSLFATECGCFEEIRGEAEQRIMELRDKSRVTHSDYPSRELSTSFVSEGLVCNALLLGGRYEKVFEMCKGKGPLGWSSSDNAKPVFVSFMLKVLSKEERHTKILYKQWDEAIVNTSFYANKEFIEKYRKIVDFVTKSLHLTREQEEFYLKWCIKTIGGRVDAIVGNQHRGSYHKAAGLLVAMAETLANREDKQEGMQLIERYRSKYPRHSAFKSEVIKAVQASDIY